MARFFEYTLLGAYGRRYTNVTDLRRDFYDGKDFILNGVGRDTGRYCSIRDIPSGTKVKARTVRGTLTVMEV